jgi:hypothetical protein
VDPPSRLAHGNVVPSFYQPPDLRLGELWSRLHQPSRSLREDLEEVVLPPDHGSKYAQDKLLRHFLMEEVAHGVHEDHPRLRPTEGSVEEVVVKLYCSPDIP